MIYNWTLKPLYESPEIVVLNENYVDDNKFKLDTLVIAFRFGFAANGVVKVTV